MPQPGRFCARCAQAFIPKRKSYPTQKYCSTSCRDNFHWYDEKLGFWRNYNWNHECDAMGREYLRDDMGERIITWEEKADPEELMTDEEYQLFEKSNGSIFPERLRDYDDMISPVLDLPQEDA